MFVLVYLKELVTEVVAEVILKVAQLKKVVKEINRSANLFVFISQS